MARGSKYLPVMEVFVGEVMDRQFEIYDSGVVLDISGSTCDISATFNDEIAFAEALTVTDGPNGLLTLPGLDRYDEEGDWKGSILIVLGGETIFAEEFIIRVKTPGGR